MISTILDALLPVALVILAGWGSGRLGQLKQVDAKVMATLVVRYALPLALFEGAIKTTPDKFMNLELGMCLTFGLMGTYLFALLIGRVVFKHNLKTATMQALVCAFPDMAYFGAPILAVLFGPSGFLVVLMGNLVTSMIMLPVTIVLSRIGDAEQNVSGSELIGVFGKSILGAIKNPIVWVPILGVVLSANHLSLPAPVMASVDMVAKAAGGVSLFALGLMLYGERPKINRDVIANIAMKNFLQPGLMALGLLLFGLTRDIGHQVLITGAVPTATAAAMFALRSNTYGSNAASTILVSTVLGIFSTGALIGMVS